MVINGDAKRKLTFSQERDLRNTICRLKETNDPKRKREVYISQGKTKNKKNKTRTGILKALKQ
jgi:hypothetical protein